MGTSYSKQIKRFPSDIGYDYATIRITQGRIAKGLLAIPKGLAQLFPAKNGKVNIYLDGSAILLPKTYSTYDSATRECRIGGMRDWFEKKRIRSGDEIVIQVIDKDNAIYRLSQERIFVEDTQQLQKKFETARHEEDAAQSLSKLHTWTNVDPNFGYLSEFARLARTMNIKDRRPVSHDRKTKETVPTHLRMLFEKIYKGHCQLCDFWFLMKDRTPYFEIHHINPQVAHHPQNLVVVCGNCHNQFEHSEAKMKFDSSGWLRQVKFNEKKLDVFQALLETKIKDAQKTLYL